MRTIRFLIITAYLGVFVAKTASAQAVDLSAGGTANCYIVTGQGEYSFLPTKGNQTTPLEAIASVDWLWQSNRKLVSDVRLMDGKCTFKAGSAKGNALIAAFNDKGEIIWSWHIWATDDPAANLHSVSGGSAILLDRNLGAISTKVDNVDSYGLFYQWGRKDPFIGGHDAGSTSLERREDSGFQEATAKVFFNPACKGYRFGAIANTNSRVGKDKSIEYGIANPTMFVGFKEEMDGSGDGSWFNTPYGEFDRLWGYVHSKRDNHKTIYDPCPAGYKVPGASAAVWEGFENAEPTGKLSGYVYYYDGQEFYYPACGSRRQNNGRLQYTGAHGMYWSAMPHEHNGRVMRIEAKEVRTNVKVPRAMGIAVRCVKE